MQSRKRYRNIGFGIFLLAFLIRFVHLNLLLKTPLFFPSGLDPAFFHSWAKEIIQGIILRQPFPALPLYPYFLALLYKISHINLYFVYFIQILLSSLSCSLIYLIAKRVFNSKVALVAGLIACFYGMFVFYSSILVGATLAIFLTLLAIFILVKNERLGLFSSLSAGLLLGLSCLVRSTNLLFFLFLLFYFLAKKVKKETLLVFSLAFFLFPGITLLRNYAVSKKLIFTAHSGINLYLANNPQAKGKFETLLGRSSEEILQNGRLIAEKKLGRSLTLSQSSVFWRQEAINFIKQNPLSFLTLCCKKFLLFYQAKEIPDVEDYNLCRRYVLPFLRFPFLSLRLILPLAILGFFLSFKRKNLLLHLFWLSQNLSLCLFWVNTRYRLLSVPIFIIFAAFSLIWLKEKIKQKRYKPVSLFLVLVFLLSVLVNLGKGRHREAIAAFHYNLGVAYSRQKDYNKAVRELNEAYNLQINAATVFALGTAYFQKGDVGKAKEYFGYALTLYPNAETHYNLGFVHQEKGEIHLAKQKYKKAIALNPYFLPARYKLSQLYLEEGKLEMALAEIKKVLQESPQNKEANELKNEIEERMSDKL